MRLLRRLGTLGVACQLAGCQGPAPATTSQAGAPAEPMAATSRPPLPAPGTRQGVSDSLDLCYELLPQKSPTSFFKSQHLPFVRSTDTVSNDERGLFLGPKLVLGSSYIQWDDHNQVRRLFIEDARIRLSHGLRVGLPQRAVLQQLGWRGPSHKLPDTLSIDCGFLDNGADLVFRKGRLASVSLVNEAD